jgi:hypothetical protein
LLEVKDDFCAITLSAMDGKPISRSTSLLATATAANKTPAPNGTIGIPCESKLGTPPTETETEPVTGWLL